jgi:hypothetical protein
MDEEPILSLSHLAPPDTVYDQADIKLYRARIVLDYVDRTAYDLSKTKYRVPADAPVKVFDGDDRLIGFGSIVFVKNHFEADIAVDYATEERLLIETGEIKIYGRLRGHLQMPRRLEDQYVLDLQSKPAVDTMVVSDIILSRVKPGDDRVLPVGAPVLATA